MTADDKRQLYALLKNVHSFYKADLSTFAAQVWWSALQNYSIEQIQSAFTAHAVDPKEGRFMPKPADIVRVLQGTHEERALVAWGSVMQAMERHGSWSSVAFDDPVIHAVITDLGGWTTLCQTKYEELPFVQKRFCDAFRAYAVKGVQSYPPLLLGNADRENLRMGYPTTSPVLIGDASKAKLVIENGSAVKRTSLDRLLEQAASRQKEEA